MENKPIKESISSHNAPVYLDMATDMLKKKNGLYSFIIKIDGKHISDYVQMDSFVYSETTIQWSKQ